jgi:putative ABC transport system substrate-binding protein
MNRRAVMSMLGGAAVGWPLVVQAQQRTLPVVGFLSGESADLFADRLRAFRQGLNQAGYVEGKNVTIEYRWAEGQNDRLAALAADLVRRKVTVIAVISGVPAAKAARAVTTDIPIVFQTAADPVELKLVASLSRPGGNVTGVTTLNVEVGPKRLELMRELLPNATVLAFLSNPTNPIITESTTRNAQAAARKLGFDLRVLHASAEGDLDAAFASLHRLQAGGLVIGSDGFFNARSEQLGALALRYAVPAIFQYRDFAAAGGLMSYGASVAESPRLVGVYVGRILHGEKPADLPVQQATKVELIINLKTAKALGITVPLPLSGRADEVIE